MAGLPFPSARCSWLLIALLSGSAAAAEPQPTPESRAHFRAGLEAFRANQWNVAYREFKAAYDITRKWTALGNLGMSAAHLERDGEAISFLEQYLERGGAELDESRKAQVRGHVERLKKGVAEVTLEASGPFWVVDTRVDAGTPVVNEYGPFEGRAELRVRAGEHEFQLDKSAVDAPAWRARLLPGDTATHEFVTPVETTLVPDFERRDVFGPPEADDAPPAASNTASYVLWGTGAAAAIGATVLLLHASSLQDEADASFRRKCPLGPTGMDGCETTTDADRRVASWKTASLVTGIGAAGAVVTGTVLFLLNGSSSSAYVEEPAEASFRPWLSPAGIGVTGRF